MIGAWNYTMGPALVYRGKKDLTSIQNAREPVVVIAEQIAFHDIMKVDLRHIRGFVLKGHEQDDILTHFLASEKRAAVRGIETILEDVKDGDTVIVDGVSGEVFVNPDAETVARYAELRRRGAPPFAREHLPRLVSQIVRNLPKQPTPQIPDGMDLPEGAIENIKAPPDIPVEAVENAVLGKLIPFVNRALEDDERALVRELIGAELKKQKEEAAAAAPGEGKAADERSAKRNEARARVEARRAELRTGRGGTAEAGGAGAAAATAGAGAATATKAEPKADAEGDKALSRTDEAKARVEARRLAAAEAARKLAEERDSKRKD